MDNGLLNTYPNDRIKSMQWMIKRSTKQHHQWMLPTVLHNYPDLTGIDAIVISQPPIQNLQKMDWIWDSIKWFLLKFEEMKAQNENLQLTQYKAWWCCCKHAWRNQQYAMRPFKCTIHNTTDAHSKHSHNKTCNNCLHLNQRNVTHNHMDDITPACHPAQIGLSR